MLLQSSFSQASYTDYSTYSTIPQPIITDHPFLRMRTSGFQLLISPSLFCQKIYLRLWWGSSWHVCRGSHCQQVDLDPTLGKRHLPVWYLSTGGTTELFGCTLAKKDERSAKVEIPKGGKFLVTLITILIGKKCTLWVPPLCCYDGYMWLNLQRWCSCCCRSLVAFFSETLLLNSTSRIEWSLHIEAISTRSLQQRKSSASPQNRAMKWTFSRVRTIQSAGMTTWRERFWAHWDGTHTFSSWNKLAPWNKQKLAKEKHHHTHTHTHTEMYPGIEST